jgi:hypothetical protein
MDHINGLSTKRSKEVIDRPIDYSRGGVANLTHWRRQSRVQPSQSAETPISPAGDPFQPGAVVLLTLGNPREKFWGAILALTVQGLSLSASNWVDSKICSP